MADIDKDVKIAVKADTTDVNAKLNQAGQKAKEFGDKAKTAGDKASSGMEKAKAGADKAKIGFGVAAIAVQGFTSQVAGLGQAVLDFESKVVALDKTIVGLEGQEIALRRAQEDLNKAVEEGTIADRDFHRALEDIELAYKNVQLESKNVEAETKKLSGEYVSFGINAVGAVAQISIAFVAMGVTAGGVLKATVAGVKLLSGALWTVAKHPVFLIITAGILAWELGLKSIVENLTGIEDLGIFSNMQKAFEGLTEGESSMEELNRQTREFGDTVERGLPVYGSMADKIDDVGDSANNTTGKIKNLTLAQEQLMRSGGFRAGPGQPLSAIINREADEIDRATARTLASASLHQALKDAGLTGSVSTRNVSGTLNPGGFKPARDKGGPIGGLGSLAVSMFNKGASAAVIARSLARGKSSARFSSFKGATTSGSLSSSVGAGRGSRRRGRDRNPLGRKDKFSSILQAKARRIDQLPENQALLELTGIGSVEGGGFIRFGNNDARGTRERELAMLAQFEENRRKSRRRRVEAFKALKSEVGIGEAKGISAIKFIKLRSTPGGFKEIRGVINFQKKAGEMVTGTTT